MINGKNQLYLTEKNILLISPEPWGPNHVSKHHYARELAIRGNQVYFLNAPGHEKSKRDITDGLIVVNYKSRHKGLRFLPRWASALFIKQAIARLENQLNISFDIIWNFDTSRFFNLASLKGKLRICHLVDMSEDLQREMLAKTSDICLCTSDYIARELRTFNTLVFKIHHGYQNRRITREIQKLKLDSGRINVGYVGNLAIKYINWELVLKLINSFANVDFHFIGSYKASNLSKSTITTSVLKELKDAENVFLHGPKESHTIPAYLNQFDILINAYLINNKADLMQLSSPHKIVEYLGSGKVIVSTYVDEYKDKKHLLEMVDTNEDFFIKFSNVVENLAFYNSEVKQKERNNFTMDNTYEKQLDRIEKILIDQ